MKNLGEIKESKDITTKEYVDGKMVIIDNTDIIEKINSNFNGSNRYTFNVSELLTEDEKNKLKNADSVQLALESLGGNSYYRIALHKTEGKEFFEGTGIVTSTINSVNIMSLVLFTSYYIMEIRPLTLGIANTNPNIFGNFSYVNKNYVDNQISTAGEGKFLPLEGGGTIIDPEHPTASGNLITSVGMTLGEVGRDKTHTTYGINANFNKNDKEYLTIQQTGLYIVDNTTLNASKQTQLELGALNFTDSKGVVSGLATPTTNTQAANKAYVDALGTRVSTNEDNIAMAESDIESLQNDVSTLKTDNTSTKNAVKTLQDTTLTQTDADNRYLKLIGGGTIVEENSNNDTLEIKPYSLKFLSTGVELDSAGMLNLSAVGQINGVIKGLANPTQDDYAANKAYVDSRTSQTEVLTTIVNSTDINEDNLISVVNIANDEVDIATSDATTIYFQYEDNALYDFLTERTEYIDGTYEFFLDISSSTTERYPLHKLPESIRCTNEIENIIYYTSGIISLKTTTNQYRHFIVFGANIMKSGESNGVNSLIFINMDVNP